MEGAGLEQLQRGPNFGHGSRLGVARRGDHAIAGGPARLSRSNQEILMADFVATLLDEESAAVRYLSR